VDVYELIKAADILITYNSTTGLEALIAGIPLVSLAPPGKPSVYILRKVAFGASSSEELVNIIGRLLSVSSENSLSLAQEDISAYLKEEVAFLGRASSRVSDLIQHMMLANESGVNAYRD